MLKKHKILALITVLTASGIIVVLSIWLYGSYTNRKELFLADTERSLFNVLQQFYHQDVLPLKNNVDSSRDYRALREQLWMRALAEHYPLDKVEAVRNSYDSIMSQREQQRKAKLAARTLNPTTEAPQEILPPYLLNKFDFNASVLQLLKQKLDESLRRNGIRESFELQLVPIQRTDLDRYYQARLEGPALMTRPILVNPEADEFLIARFANPWRQLLFNLSWQLSIFCVLVAATLGSFFYLLYTIRQQNQLAEIRKTFVKNMTHELKTPISTVMAAVESIQRYGAKEDKQRLDRYLEIAKHELEHLNDMVERVLRFDVDEKKGLHLELESFDVVALSKDCLEAAEMSLPKKVNLYFTSNMPKIVLIADQGHIKNVINNLLDNAIKYSGDPVRIDVVLEQRFDRLLLSIRDTGHGIAKAHQSMVFDSFFRIPQGNLYGVKGFGLGLSYVKQVVEAHGGNILLQSELAKGCLFTITLYNSKKND